MNFSKIKNVKIPKRRNNDKLSVKPNSSAASGSRCIKASQSKAPAAKLTKKIKIFFRFIFPNNNVTAPINEIKLTNKTLMIE